MLWGVWVLPATLGCFRFGGILGKQASREGVSVFCRRLFGGGFIRRLRGMRRRSQWNREAVAVFGAEAFLWLGRGRVGNRLPIIVLGGPLRLR